MESIPFFLFTSCFLVTLPVTWLPPPSALSDWCFYCLVIVWSTAAKTARNRYSIPERANSFTYTLWFIRKHLYLILWLFGNIWLQMFDLMIWEGDVFEKYDVSRRCSSTPETFSSRRWFEMLPTCCFVKSQNAHLHHSQHEVISFSQAQWWEMSGSSRTGVCRNSLCICWCCHDCQLYWCVFLYIDAGRELNQKGFAINVGCDKIFLN